MLEVYFDTPDAFPDQPIVGSFTVLGDLIIQSSHNDLFSLNYVYLFRDAHLVAVEPFGAWYLEQLSGPTISLYRKMDRNEFKLWKKKRLGELGRDWGHGTKVVHFSTERGFTSAAGRKNDPVVKIEVARAVLLQHARNLKVWSGTLNDERVAEFVLPFDLISKLVSRGELKVDY